jgi:hypothetical protein
MLYKYEEWTDPETLELIIAEGAIDWTSYEHLHNFIQATSWAGQCGNSVVHGMGVFWCVVYCGY